MSALITTLPAIAAPRGHATRRRMRGLRTSVPLTLIWLLTACSQTQDEPGQVARLTLEVENYASSNCSFVTVRSTNGRQLYRLDDRCHGWSVEDCNGSLFLRTVGVTADWGTLVAARREVAVQLPPLINTKLADRSPSWEIVHLEFAPTRCTRGRFEIPFVGSSIRRGGSGSALPLTGTVTMDARGGLTVRLAAE